MSTGLINYHFQRLRSAADPGNMFYMQDEPEAIEVAMMRSRGEFKTATSKTLKAQIIELPYEVGEPQQQLGERGRKTKLWAAAH